jgi:hypothetical protein
MPMFPRAELTARTNFAVSFSRNHPRILGLRSGKVRSTKPPCLMVAHDGKAKDWNLPTVLDNMIHSGDIPVQLGIFVMPGVVPVTTIQHRHVSTVASNTTAWATSTPDF